VQQQVARLTSFLALLPPDQLDAAQQQVAGQEFVVHVVFVSVQ
jgi:hypothetical protein